MTKQEFDKLQIGDVVTGTSGNGYVIVNVQMTPHLHYTAVRVVDVSDPAEWQKYQKQ